MTEIPTPLSIRMADGDSLNYDKANSIYFFTLGMVGPVFCAARGCSLHPGRGKPCCSMSLSIAAGAGWAVIMWFSPAFGVICDCRSLCCPKAVVSCQHHHWKTQSWRSILFPGEVPGRTAWLCFAFTGEINRGAFPPDPPGLLVAKAWEQVGEASKFLCCCFSLFFLIVSIREMKLTEEHCIVNCCTFLFLK